MMDVASWLFLFFVFCIAADYISDSCNAAVGFSLYLSFCPKYDALFHTCQHRFIQMLAEHGQANDLPLFCQIRAMYTGRKLQQHFLGQKTESKICLRR
jgi:hypothetical protein